MSGILALAFFVVEAGNRDNQPTRKEFHLRGPFVQGPPERRIC